MSARLRSDRPLSAMRDAFHAMLVRAFFDLRSDEIVDLAEIVRRGADVLDNICDGQFIAEINAKLGTSGDTLNASLREIAPRVRSS